MYTNYGPYDTYQVELSNQDRERMVKEQYTPTFEGVNVKVNKERRSRSAWLNALVSLFHKAGQPSPAAQPLRRHARHA